MLLTARRGGPPAGTAAVMAKGPDRSLLLLGAVALSVLELLGLVDGGRLELGPHDVPHGHDPVGDDVPLLAVPLLDEDGAVPLVVLAGHLDRVGEPLHAEVVQ